MIRSTLAYIALGSNLETPLNQLSMAVDAIDKLEDCSLVAVSSWYKNPAIGPGEQNDYINGVMALETTRQPLQLLDTLQSIEHQQGRERSNIRWQARTLDLDILLYGQQQIDCERLTVPHPRMLERAFVMFPLYEIAPDLHLPNGESVKQITSQLSNKALEKLVISG